jgi:hypothetical protein
VDVASRLDVDPVWLCQDVDIVAADFAVKKLIVVLKSAECSHRVSSRIPPRGMRDLTIEAKTTQINLCDPSPDEGLNSFDSRLSRRYLAASPSLSLVPLAPFLAPLGMTTLLPRDDRHKIAYWFLFRDRKCASVGALEPKGAGGAAVEIERSLNFEVGNGDSSKNV